MILKSVDESLRPENVLGGHMLHVSCSMQEGSNVRDILNGSLRESVAFGDEQQTFQVVGGNLIENHLDVELIVQPERQQLLPLHSTRSAITI